MKISTLLIGAAIVFGARSADAQTVHFTAGLAGGALIIGGRSTGAGTAKATSGFALMPRAEIAIGSTSVPWADITFAVAPMLVDPSSLDAIGMIGAHDLGLDFHPPSRLWNIAIRGSIAPSYMRWCNVQWCLKEWIVAPGGEVAGSFHPASEEAGVDIGGSVRLLHAEPTAWTWDGLSMRDKLISREMWIVTASASWRW